MLILGAGLIAICLLAFAVLVDASAGFLQRQQLLALADATALAGAQAIDLSAYYREGASASTQLDPAAVAARARDHLSRARAIESIDGMRIEALASDGRQVVVALSAPLRLPFWSELLGGRVRVESRAQLAYRNAG